MSACQKPVSDWVSPIVPKNQQWQTRGVNGTSGRRMNRRTRAWGLDSRSANRGIEGWVVSTGTDRAFILDNPALWSSYYSWVRCSCPLKCPCWQLRESLTSSHILRWKRYDTHINAQTSRWADCAFVDWRSHSEHFCTGKLDDCLPFLRDHPL